MEIHIGVDFTLFADFVTQVLVRPRPYSSLEASLERDVVLSFMALSNARKPC